MEKGDLGTYEEHALVVVLEGVLASPQWQSSMLRKPKLLPAMSWPWARTSLKQMVAYGRQNTSVDVVTFLDRAVADEAAEYFMTFDIPFASCAFNDYELFCESLTWRPSISRVIDSSPNRLAKYGARAYETQWGSVF